MSWRTCAPAHPCPCLKDVSGRGATHLGTPAPSRAGFPPSSRHRCASRHRGRAEFELHQHRTRWCARRVDVCVRGGLRGVIPQEVQVPVEIHADAGGACGPGRSGPTGRRKLSVCASSRRGRPAFAGRRSIGSGRRGLRSGRGKERRRRLGSPGNGPSGGGSAAGVGDCEGVVGSAVVAAEDRILTRSGALACLGPKFAGSPGVGCGNGRRPGHGL